MSQCRVFPWHTGGNVPGRHSATSLCHNSAETRRGGAHTAAQNRVERSQGQKDSTGDKRGAGFWARPCGVFPVAAAPSARRAAPTTKYHTHVSKNPENTKHRRGDGVEITQQPSCVPPLSLSYRGETPGAVGTGPGLPALGSLGALRPPLRVQLLVRAALPQGGGRRRRRCHGGRRGRDREKGGGSSLSLELGVFSSVYWGESGSSSGHVVCAAAAGCGTGTGGFAARRCRPEAAVFIL